MRRIKSIKTTLYHWKKAMDQPFSLYLVHAGYCFLLFYLLFFAGRFCYSLYRLDYSIHTVPIPLFLGCLFLLPSFWVYSTKFDFYHFHYRKLLTLCLILSLEGLLVLCLCFQLLSWLFIPSLLKIPVNEVFTKGMALALCRVCTQLPLLLLGFLLGHTCYTHIRSKDGYEKILNFKISHYVKGSRSKGGVKYDMKVVRDMKTGKPISVPMEDRFLHTLVDGSSGTAKTSSTLLPSIRDDLDNRCKAEDQIKKTLMEFIQSGKIAPLSRRPFSYSDLTITGENPDQIRIQLDTLRQRFPLCGLTVLAPEDSLTDAVCDLCDARQIPYNRIDPVRLANGEKKQGWIGMNPFFIPAGYQGEKRDSLIVKRAVIFADVMQAITDLKGSADSYFTGINRQMLANLSILSMLTIPLLHHRQATPADLQRFINNFDSISPYIDKLEDRNNETFDYTVIIEYVRNELLGKGRIKMEDQCRGTRNIINEFLLLPANKEIFCSQNSIDFDYVLEHDEITVFNYNLASGDTDATALGLLFLLSFNNAVLSRPGTEKSRSPHFFYVDEFPVLLHPSEEKNFSLFRKFRVAMCVAIQTLDQFEKNPLTKYLKGVILGCANTIVFGRSSLTDMVQFSKFSGMQDTIDTQTTVTQTSLSQADARLTYSSRDTWMQKNIVEETQIRMKDFQEVTFFYTVHGRPIPPIHGKVNFLKKSDWLKKDRPFYPIYEEPISHVIPTTLNALYQSNTWSADTHGNEFPQILNAMYGTDKQDAPEEPVPAPPVRNETDEEEESIEDLF